MFDDRHSITEADGEMSVVAVADSTQLSDETKRSDALSDQLDGEAQPGSGCGELPSGYDVQAILVVLYTLGEINSMTLQETGLLAGLIEKWTNIVTRQCCMKISLLYH